MRRILIPLLAGLVLAANGCKKEESRDEAAAPARASAEKGAAPQDLKTLGYIGPSSPKASPAPAAPPAAKRSPAIARKLIRTVDFVLEVKDSTEVAKRAEALVNGMGGYVSASNARRQGEVVLYTMTLRVPADHIEQALNALRSLAVRIDREHQQVEDVTDQYIDLDAHRRTLEATEKELSGLLAESRQKGRKADEIMEIYRQLTDIRTQIEQIQTQISSYDKLAALSTINLELVPTESAKPVSDQSWHPSDNLRSSIRSLIGFLQWLLDFLVYAVIVLLPVGLVIAVAVIGLLWLWRRGRRVTIGTPPPPPPPGGEPPVR
jgi:hypothetical protein